MIGDNGRMRVTCFVIILVSFATCRERELVNSLMDKARSLDSMERYEDAIGIYDSVIKIDPKNIGAYLNRGIDKGLLGDTQGEVLDLQEIVKLDPNNTLALFNLGVAYANLNNTKESLESFNAAIRSKGGENVWLEMKPNDFVETGYEYDCPMERIRLERGIIYYRVDSLKKAYYDFTFCIEKKYELGESYYYRGLSYLRSNLKELGCQDLEYSRLNGMQDAFEALNRHCK